VGIAPRWIAADRGTIGLLSALNNSWAGPDHGSTDDDPESGAMRGAGVRSGADRRAGAGFRGCSTSRDDLDAGA